MDEMSARHVRQTAHHASTLPPSAHHVSLPLHLTILEQANVHAAKDTTVRVITRVHRYRLTVLVLMTLQASAPTV